VTARFIVADVFDGLRSLLNDSVDLVFTSPPFLALRSYLPADHPDKAKEIGSEPTPAAFIDTLLDVTEELARVLAPHGSLCVELGDTYSGSIGADTDGALDRNAQQGRERGGGVARPGRRTNQGGWPLDKSLCLIPESYRWALTYGRNPFNGRQTEPWRVRNVVRWHRPNPPVGALGDKFRPSTSDVVVACKSRTRYFDLDAVQTEHVNPRPQDTNGSTVHPAGAPPLDTWIIPTEPYKGAHYATFPSDLVVKPVAAMCPERVCVVCGGASRRITGDAEYVSTVGGRVVNQWAGDRRGDAVNQWTVAGGNPGHAVRRAPTLGWTDCGHDSWRRGVVLDPFAGSGTVLAVATGHGRDAIGIDLDERNADLALSRCGLFFDLVAG
jgi:site-specific DNA-methyltransferase (cytosine-N4-specific)